MRLFLPKLYDQALILAERLDECFDRIAQAINGRLDRGNMHPLETFQNVQYEGQRSLYTLSAAGTAPGGVPPYTVPTRLMLGVVPIDSLLVAAAMHFRYYPQYETAAEEYGAGEFAAIVQSSGSQSQIFTTLHMPTAQVPLVKVQSWENGTNPSLVAGDVLWAQRDTDHATWDAKIKSVQFVAVLKALHVA